MFLLLKVSECGIETLRRRYVASGPHPPFPRVANFDCEDSTARVVILGSGLLERSHSFLLGRPWRLCWLEFLFGERPELGASPGTSKSKMGDTQAM